MLERDLVIPCTVVGLLQLREQMPTILVTGGSGFIGSHTCISLLSCGYDVIIFDNHSNSKVFPSLEVASFLSINNPDRIKIIHGDICKPDDIEHVFLASEKIDAVIHFAGLKSIPESFKNPSKYWSTNVAGTINILNCMAKYSCENIIFSSSATIYGGGQGKQISESDLINPTSPYGWTKFISEKIIHDQHKAAKESANSCDETSKTINAIILRYFNPVGAIKNGIIGESPLLSATNLFPTIMKVINGEDSQLNIFGNDWPTIDGTGVRDYIHVMDLAEGHVAAINYLLATPNCFIELNLGTGVGYSVLQVINTFEQIVGHVIPHTFHARRDGDVASCVADSSLARKILKWKAKRELSEMCFDSWNYWSKYLGSNL